MTGPTAPSATGRASGGAGRRTMNRRFVVTGGPGGGKSTLLEALAERGYRVAPEAARRLIGELEMDEAKAVLVVVEIQK